MPNRLLLIDDEAALREILCELLGGCGFEVKAAEDPAEALKTLRSERFDAILCDQHLGGSMRGTDLIDAARAQGLLKQTACVLLTGMSPKSLARADLTVLQKPFEVDALLETLRSAIAQAAPKPQPRPSLHEVQADLLETELAPRLKDRIGRTLNARRERLELSSRALGLGRVAASTAELLREEAHPKAQDRRADEAIAVRVGEMLQRLEDETETLQKKVESLTALAHKIGLAV